MFNCREIRSWNMKHRFSKDKSLVHCGDCINKFRKIHRWKVKTWKHKHIHACRIAKSKDLSGQKEVCLEERMYALVSVLTEGSLWPRCDIWDTLENWVCCIIPFPRAPLFISPDLSTAGRAMFPRLACPMPALWCWIMVALQDEFDDDDDCDLKRPLHNNHNS